MASLLEGAAARKLPVGVSIIAKDSPSVLRASRSNELFIAIVAPAGAGAGTAAKILKSYLENVGPDGDKYSVEIVKASDRIREWADKAGKEVPTPGRKTLEASVMMQNRGDEYRAQMGDNSAVARAVLAEIRKIRAKASGTALAANVPVEPDGKRRAYIIDSLRHPAEAHLLRRLYQDAFSLVGVVCDPTEREKRLRHNLFDRKDWDSSEVKIKVQNFMDRDADAPERHGQHVVSTFHESDYFVDNSLEAGDSLSNTSMNDALLRFVQMLTTSNIVRPSIFETAMHQASSAQLRSARLSRQVGAALVDANGNIVATGTNEVPRGGGGVYGEGYVDPPAFDIRCAFRETVYCSSNREQNDIILELLRDFPELLATRSEDEALRALRRTRVGGLIEFSRAVHAEMDAILSASRVGVSPAGCRLFVTAFPCHYCARHIVSAGIDEVQYIEPYPKSRALRLHDDAITTDAREWQRGLDGAGPRKVLFRPFVGVAPRMYSRLFLKDRDYKDSITGNASTGVPEWGGPVDTFKVPYTKLEMDLATSL